MTTETDAPEVGTHEAEGMELARVEVGEGWRGDRDIVGEFVANGQERVALAKRISDGGLFPNLRNKDAVLTIMLAAFEMGVPVM